MFLSIHLPKHDHSLPSVYSDRSHPFSWLTPLICPYSSELRDLPYRRFYVKKCDDTGDTHQLPLVRIPTLLTVSSRECDIATHPVAKGYDIESEAGQSAWFSYFVFAPSLISFCLCTRFLAVMILSIVFISTLMVIIISTNIFFFISYCLSESECGKRGYTHSEWEGISRKQDSNPYERWEEYIPWSFIIFCTTWRFDLNIPSCFVSHYLISFLLFSPILSTKFPFV